MKPTSLKHSCLLPLLAVVACSGEPDNISATDPGDVDANAQDERQPVDLNEVDLPPMVERSPAYRCDDGDALYVDVLSDRGAVLVRDSRSDTPVRLEREGDEGEFSGEGRTLSGTGEQVSYSGPDRPSQTCRQAEE